MGFVVLTCEVLCNTFVVLVMDLFFSCIGPKLGQGGLLLFFNPAYYSVWACSVTVCVCVIMNLTSEPVFPFLKSF